MGKNVENHNKLLVDTYKKFILGKHKSMMDNYWDGKFEVEPFLRIFDNYYNYVKDLPVIGSEQYIVRINKELPFARRNLQWSGSTNLKREIPISPMHQTANRILIADTLYRKEMRKKYDTIVKNYKNGGITVEDYLLDFDNFYSYVRSLPINEDCIAPLHLHNKDKGYVRGNLYFYSRLDSFEELGKEMFIYAKWKGMLNTCYNEEGNFYGRFEVEEYLLDFDNYYNYTTSLHNYIDGGSVVRIDKNKGFNRNNISWK